MNSEIMVKTLYNKEMIDSYIEMPAGDFIEKSMRKIIRLQDEQIKKALIELGWTPPKESE